MLGNSCVRMERFDTVYNQQNKKRCKDGHRLHMMIIMARLMMTAFNGKYPAKVNDYNCEPVMEFRFGEGTTEKNI